jgi:endonuclease G, mitochondrial
MNKILVAFFLSIGIAASASAAGNPPPAACTAQAPYGMPVDHKENSNTLCRTAYLVQHDNIAKIPVWVSYVLTPEHTLGCVPRSNSFAADTELPINGRSLPADYAGSGYDQGHIASDGDMSWDPKVERQSFLMSNMTPQLPGFNRGIWKKLEDQTRAWAQGRNHNLIVYAGPVYNYNNKTIGNSHVIVPNGFYKIVIDTVTRETLVFEFDHASSSNPVSSFLTTLNKVQADTGIYFPMPEGVSFSQTTWPASTKSIRKAKSVACSTNLW